MGAFVCEKKEGNAADTTTYFLGKMGRGRKTVAPFFA